MATRQEWDEKLLGIGFQSPSTLLDAKTPLIVPQSADKEKSNVGTPFLWQAPTSEAVLFLGDKWVELHGYISQVLEKQHTMNSSPALLATREVGKNNPAWLEYALQLSRIRGYVTLYPGPETASAILGIHTDLYEQPEEYIGESAEDEPEPGEGDHATELFDAGSQVNMLNTLPQNGKLPPLQELPLLSWDGKQTDMDELSKAAIKYAQVFRKEVGECEDSQAKELAKDRHARDLFCDYNEAEA